MTVYNWPNGLGASTGDVLGTCKPLATTGTIYYVSYAEGNDANDGGDYYRPKKTLAGAVAVATGGADIIALRPEHDESITSSVTPSTGTTIVGLGTTSGKPSARLTRAFAGAPLLLSNFGVAIRNIYFPESTQSSANRRIVTSNLGQYIRDCYFECGHNDTSSSLHLNTGTGYLEIRDCTFVSVSTAPSGGAETQAPPDSAISVGDVLNDIRIDGLVLDGGVGGWGNYYAANLSGFNHTRLRVETLSLLRGSDVRINASTTGYLNAQTVTGSGKVFW